MKKRLIALLMGAMLLTLAGCAGVSDTIAGVGNAIQADGREYGQTYELKQDETMKTSFFDLTVNSVQLTESVEDYMPEDEANQFLVVNVTIKNTLEGVDAIPMYGSDFELNWEALGEETIFPTSAFAEGQLADEYELKEAEECTGNLIFEVPGDVSDFKFKFYELWDDEFEGNTFWMSLTAAAQ